MRIRLGIIWLLLLLVLPICAAGMSIRDVKLLTDASPVTLSGRTVTYAGSGFFYVEEDSKSMGIRVEKPYHGLTVGMRVDIEGSMATQSNNERYVRATTAVQSGTGTISPMGMSNKAVGGGSWSVAGTAGQRGANNCRGANNIGLLVRTCGQFRLINPTAFTVDDGSAGGLRCSAPLGMPISSKWQSLVVTGISSMYAADGSPMLLVRDVAVLAAGDSNPGFVNVTDYGAVGDGITDDADAIQLAIDAVTVHGGTVYFPAGTYLIKRSIYVKDHVTLMGTGIYGGSRIKVADASHTTLTQMAAQGDAVLHVADSSSFRVGQVVAVYTPADMADPASVRNLKLRDTTIVAAVGAGTITLTEGLEYQNGYPAGSTVFSASNALELNTSTAGLIPVQADPTSYVTIEDLEVDGNFAGQIGIGSSDEYQCGIHAVASSYVTIQRCWVHDTANAGIEFSHIHTTGSNHMVIDSCLVERAAAKGALHLDCTVGLRVTNNVIADTAGTGFDAISAVFLHGLAGGTDLRDAVLSGNDITTDNGSGIGNLGISIVGYCYNVSISGGTIHDCPAGGIGFCDDSSLYPGTGANVGATILGVIFDNCGIGVTSFYAPSSSGLVIQGCRFVSNSTSPCIVDNAIGSVIANNSIEQYAPGFAGIYACGYKPSITGNQIYASADAQWGIVTSPTGLEAGCKISLAPGQTSVTTGATISAAGSRYLAGQDLSVLGGSTNALIKVTGIDWSGRVLGFDIVDPGAGYATSATDLPTSKPTFATISDNVIQVDSWHREGLFIGMKWGESATMLADVVTLLDNVVLFPPSNGGNVVYSAAPGSVIYTSGGAIKI